MQTGNKMKLRELKEQIGELSRGEKIDLNILGRIQKTHGIDGSARFWIYNRFRRKTGEFSRNFESYCESRDIDIDNLSYEDRIEVFYGPYAISQI
jgi:hypothetical protein